ncbi:MULTISPECIES: UDP-N-acetylmuramoyl-L-alanine--D-glutamate ligase [Campylobacter]|uniref:UDP-N-acetylmuramoyl-L-alanine--D-glutamate ligase n=1 Tax=Campylobacter TaxID=194 RepID=UPI000A3462AC|nr:UDP-N-acetylmuramoyl-L-alanine--D-glutamate ligase [Campylobacter sp. P0024]MCR8679304.1 UDP-N-acetylmuramoyl-L-alanine--D-glutamate ligase [Campylobacter sp. RM19072]
MIKSLFGYAGTTKSIARSGGWNIYDDKFEVASSDEYGNALLPVDKFNPNLSELEIPSPGFPPYHKLIKSAKNIISEYDYFRNYTPKSIWISGTNGKTTTTKMTEHLLRNRGAIMGGNVGIPLGDLVDKKAKIWILETSSFTMHYTKFASPDIYVLLPISDDHISWHGSAKEYEKAKLKPLSMMREGGVAIVPKCYENIRSNAKIIGYEDEIDLANKFSIDIGRIDFRVPFLMDAIMALAIENIIFSSLSIDLLNKFIIEPHKLEELRDSKGRLWVNDTKATNIDATLQALARYIGLKIHIILGGDDKGVSIQKAVVTAARQGALIYAIGSNCDEITKMACELNADVYNAKTLENAVNLIDKAMGRDDVALLSPACASLDQFSSYAQRGDKFKEYISQIL